MNMFFILILVMIYFMVLFICQTYQIVLLKYVHYHMSTLSLKEI